MEKYVADIYQKNIYSINYDSLLSRGIKCLLFDLDNTIASVMERTPNQEVKDLFAELKEKGFKIVIFTNNHKLRAAPFKNELEVDSFSLVRKPRPEKFLTVMNTYGFNVSETAMIGDSIVDDVAGGNGVGITTILVNPIDKKEYPFAKIRRWRENKLVKKLRDKDLFTKGRYYE